jgi:DnaK suppressor protein
MTPADAADPSKPTQVARRAGKSAPPEKRAASSASSSKKTEKAQDRESGSAKRTRSSAARPGRGVDPSADRTGKVARSPASGDDAGARTAMSTSRHRASRPPTGARASSAPGASAAKDEKKPTTKETVKKAVTATTSRTTKDTHSSGETTAEKKPARRGATAASAGPYAADEKFLAEQRQLLESERAVYLAQASDLKAEADSLAQEREPGDVQFDEESGEGGTVTVDRERDLALSAQAMAAVEEIDAALAKIADGTYGACERCGEPIPKARLKALPYARLCVACKSGGLSRR